MIEHHYKPPYNASLSRFLEQSLSIISGEAPELTTLWNLLRELSLAGQAFPGPGSWVVAEDTPPLS